MILSNEKIEIVSKFVTSNEKEGSYYPFPKVNEQLSAYLGIPAEFTVFNSPSCSQVQIWTKKLTLVIKQGDKFVWKVYIDEPSLDEMMELNSLILKLVDYKIAILELYSSILPQLEERIKTEAFINKAEWGLKYIKNFFVYFSPNLQEIDTDAKIKELSKRIFADWEHFYVSHNGKRASIDWYKRVFANFEECYNTIKEKYSNAISA